MCPGGLLPDFFSWEESGPGILQNCSPPQPTLQLLTLVCHMRPSMDCVVPRPSLTVNIYIVIIFIFSGACGIEFEDRVVVTGGVPPYSTLGSYPIDTVQVYTSEGPQYPQPPLPSLRTARYGHACGYFLDSQDRAVSIACISQLTLPLSPSTVLS